MRYFIVQTDDYSINRNQLIVRYSNIIVPIVSMSFKYIWSIFSSILELINNNENTAFYGLTHFSRIHQLWCKVFPVVTVFESLITSNLLLLYIISKVAYYYQALLHNLSCLDYFHFAWYNSFSSEICVVLQWNSL